MKSVLIVIITLILTSCFSSSFCPVAMTYFEIDNLDVDELREVVEMFAKSQKYESRGTDDNTIAYYEHTDNEDINFLVMNYFKSGCLRASFYSYKAKHVPEAMRLQPLLMASLKDKYQESLTIYEVEGCGETDL